MWLKDCGSLGKDSFPTLVRKTEKEKDTGRFRIQNHSAEDYKLAIAYDQAHKEHSLK